MSQCECCRIRPQESASVDYIADVAASLAAYTAAYDVKETIRFLRASRLDATDVWHALGHSAKHANWSQVETCMIRWLLSQEAKRHVVKQAA